MKEPSAGVDGAIDTCSIEVYVEDLAASRAPELIVEAGV